MNREDSSSELTRSLLEHYKLERNRLRFKDSGYTTVTRLPVCDMVLYTRSAMSNALIRTSHVLLGWLLGILFAGNMSAKERPLGHGSSHKIEAPGARFGPPIQIANWGNFGSPVAASTESTPGYDGAELFAGPNKFANSGDDD